MEPEASECTAQDPTDRCRWSVEANLLPAWRTRSEIAARLIPPGLSVLDLGAGRMALRDLLPPSNSYVPADLVARSDDCLVVNLNQGELPTGHYDVVVVLGVLEYMRDPMWLLRSTARVASRLVLSYFTYDGGGASDRRANGWLNSLSQSELISGLADAGWQPVVTQTFPNGETLVSCRLADASSRRLEY